MGVGMRLIVVVLLALASGVASGQVYKCTGADGKVAYSQRPCAADTEGDEMRVNTAVPESGGQAPGLRPQELLLLEEAATREAERKAAIQAQREERLRMEQQAEINAITQLRVENCVDMRVELSRLRDKALSRDLPLNIQAAYRAKADNLGEVIAKSCG